MEFYQWLPIITNQRSEGSFSILRLLQHAVPYLLLFIMFLVRTCCNISAETCLELAFNCDNITGIKEASGDLHQIMKIIKGKPENFSVISGDDMLTIPIIAAGGAGVISVLANAFPSQCTELVNNALKNNFKSGKGDSVPFSGAD